MAKKIAIWSTLVAVGIVLAVVENLSAGEDPAPPATEVSGATPEQPNATAAPSPAPSSEPTRREEKAGPKRPSQQETVVMARVGDKQITVDDFMKYISQDAQTVVKATTDNGKTELLREMILDRLIEEGMRRDQLLPTDKPPTKQDYLRAYQELAAKHFPEANAVPDEEKIHQYYLDHQQSFGIPATVRIGQIQFRVPVKATAEEIKAVRERAEETLKRLRNGESFAELAKKLTENPKAKLTEGDLGFLPLGQDPWLDKAVAGLKIGEYSEVLQSPVGYEIILLKDKRDALIAPYANVRQAVIAKMRFEAQRKAREVYAWNLAKEIGVSVEMPELKGAVP